MLPDSPYSTAMKKKKQVQNFSVFVLLILMAILLGRILLPYMSVLLWSAICYILINPLYARIVKHLNPHKKTYETKRRLLAGIFAITTIIVIFGIIFFLGFKLVGQGKVILDTAKKFVAENPNFFSNSGTGASISSFVKRISMDTIDLSSIDIKAKILLFLSTYSDKILVQTSNLLKNIGNFLISLIFMSFVLYFFYIDAAYLANLLIKAIPIDPRNAHQLLHKFHDVTANLFLGLFLVAFYQAVAAFIIFSIFRIQGALLFSFLLFFCSFIPMFGCALVWLPLGISVLITRSLISGIVFLLLCAFFISFLDNFLRPMFLKDRIKIHPLLIFFSILGGIKVFGFNGIILGPLVVILFFTIVDMAQEEDNTHTENDNNLSVL